MTSHTRDRSTARAVAVAVIVVLVIVAVVWAVQQLSSPPGVGVPEPVPALQGKDPDEAAAKSLEAYRKLVTQDDFAALGFATADDVARAELGRSYRVVLVPLDRLKAYTVETDPETLFNDAGRIIYEVRVDNEVRSSLEVGPFGDLWQGQSFGSPGLIGPIAQFTRADDDFVVFVAALNVYYLATRTSDGLFLVPLFDYPQFQLGAGKDVPAGDGLAVLVDAARQHEGLPN